MSLLLLGANGGLGYLATGMLLFVIIFFALLDLVVGRIGIIGKLLVSLLIVHRSFYVGSFINIRWLTWLLADLGKEFSSIFVRGPGPISGMVLLLLILVLLQEHYIRFISRSKGTILTLFSGAALLTWVVMDHDGSGLFQFLYTVIGLLMLGTAKLQSLASFPVRRWVSILLVWVLCLSSVAWAMPSGDLDWNELYDSMREAWESRSRPGEGGSTGPRSQTGYSSFDGNLGGPVENDVSLVMVVSSPVPVYLMGETRSFYTGRGWRTEPSYQVHAPQIRPAHVTGREVTITVEVIRSQNRIVFVPRYPLEFEFTNDKELSIFYLPTSDPLNRFGDFEYRADSRFNQGDQYTMTVLLPDDDPDLLRTLSSDALRGTDFHQLPLGYSERVIQLAQEVTADANNGYDQAKAIVDYLRSGKWGYSLDSESTPADQDFVDWFLFEQETGYCVHFATAFVIMARAVGLPARWVKGFTPGVPEGNNRYNVLNKHAHTWAEVWFDDYGWVPFEPTPGAALPSPNQDENPTTPSNPGDPQRPDEADEPTAPGTPSDPGDIPGMALPTPGDTPIGLFYGPIGALLIGLFAFMFYKFRKPLVQTGLAMVYAKLQRRLQMFGWQRYQWETPREHLERVQVLPHRPVLARFVSSFEQAVYGGIQDVDNPLSQPGVSRKFSLLGLTWYRLFKRR